MAAPPAPALLHPPRCVASTAPLLGALALSMLAPGCDPYEQRRGEYFAGSVDPANFPKPVLNRRSKFGAISGASHDDDLMLNTSGSHTSAWPSARTVPR